jgi:tRNA C32,U32 (ribose-2'-O)-methylase TrmJ
MAYEFRKQSGHPLPLVTDQKARENTMMKMGEFDQLIKHLERVLHHTAFLAGPRIRLVRKLRRLLLQGVQSTQEINILRGVLTSLEHALGVSPKDKPENKKTPT